MSTQIVKEIVCPQCGERQKYRILAGVNARENPEFRLRVLEETLFDWQCDRCNYFGAMAYPFLYTDPDLKFIVSVTPSGTDSPVEPTEAVRTYTMRRVRSLAALKEKILIFEAGLDDAAIELVKNALMSIVREKYNAPRSHAFFSRRLEDSEEIEFAVFFPGHPEPIYHAIKPAVYKQSLEILRTLDFKAPAGFAQVNNRLARQLLAEYQKDL